jgi:hypothetical protein
LEPMPEIVRGVLGASAFFATKATQCLTHCEWGLSPHVNNIDPLSMVRQRGSSTFLGALAPTSQQPGITRRVGRKSVKEL